MRLHLDKRLSFLFASAILVFAITLILLGSFIWDTEVVTNRYNVYDICYGILLFSPMLVSSFLLIQFLRRNYPSRRVKKFSLILYYISAAASTFLLVLLIVFSRDALDRPAREFIQTELRNPIKFAKALLLWFMILLQFYNNIEGIRLLIVLRRNRKKEYLEVF